MRIEILSDAQDDLVAGPPSIVEGAQQLLRAAAWTVLNTQRHHPRLNRTEAQLLLDNRNFVTRNVGTLFSGFLVQLMLRTFKVSYWDMKNPDPSSAELCLPSPGPLNDWCKSVEADTLDALVEDTKDQTGQ